MKVSMKEAIKNAKRLSAEHPNVKYIVMDKKGKRAVVTGSEWIYRERILEGYVAVAKFLGGREVKV